MSNNSQKVVLTGFMGVGKTTVAKILSYKLRLNWVDLDKYISEKEKRTANEIIVEEGIEKFREMETLALQEILVDDLFQIISLGGGTWTLERNRELIKKNNCLTIWLNAPFNFCWQNIFFSNNVRPLAKDKKKALELFEERQKYYCLADWHFAVKNQQTLSAVAQQIAEEIF